MEQLELSVEIQLQNPENERTEWGFGQNYDLELKLAGHCLTKIRIAKPSLVYTPLEAWRDFLQQLEGEDTKKKLTLWFGQHAEKEKDNIKPFYDFSSFTVEPDEPSIVTYRKGEWSFVEVRIPKDKFVPVFREMVEEAERKDNWEREFGRPEYPNLFIPPIPSKRGL